MKKIYYLLTGLIAILLCTNSVNAMVLNEDGSYTNDNGAIITQEQYNTLLLHFNENTINHLEQLQVNKYGDNNAKISSKKQSYITTYTYSKYGLLKNVSTIEATEQEAEAVKYNKNLHVINGKLQDVSNMPATIGYIEDDEHSTESKTIFIAYSNSNTYRYSAYFDVTWHTVPKVKSYDVLAFRFENSISKSAITYYTTHQNSSAGFTDYDLNGSNTKFGGNGIGVSMNLHDDGTDFWLTYDVTSHDSLGSYIVGTYQHAVSNISLATSQSYTFGSSGLGGVLVYSNGYGSYFDNMTGLKVSL